MGYHRGEEAIVGFVILLMVVFQIAGAVGWPLVLGGAGGIALLFIAIGQYRRWQQQEDRKRQALAPCDHGVIGARLNPSKCPSCTAQQVARAAQQQIEQEAERKGQERERLRAYREWAERVRLPEYLKSMDPRAFEDLVCKLFVQLGYRVESTPYAGDSGADGYLYKDGQKAVLQCKRVQGSVGEPVLRDIFGTMHAERAASAIVVTTGKVSRQAREWVAGKPIRIIELDELRRLLDQQFSPDSVVPPDFVPIPTNPPVCPQCGKSLRLVRGPHGKFLGCTGYPSCRYTRAAPRSAGR